MKKTLSYGLAFLITVVLCIAMLFIATYAPQFLIDENVIESSYGLEREGTNPSILDKGRSAELDNRTEAMILMASKAMVDDSQSTILTNPMYIYGEQNPVEALSEYVWMVKPTPAYYYTRYWMGFRAIMRWLLVFLDYFQIRRYLAVVLFSLLYCVTKKIGKNLGNAQAAVFAFSILLVRPYVICTSLQFSSCFLIAFTAMLAVPWIYKHPKYQGLFFMEVGMLTMFFDFYTVPLITFGLPMVYLYLLREKDGNGIRLWEIVKNAWIWLVSYLLMWVTKLILTDLLTDQMGISSAFARVFEWFGVGSYRRTAEAEIYSPLTALQFVWKTILPDMESQVIFWILIAGLVGFVSWKAKKHELDMDTARSSAGLLLLAICPIIWFCVTAAPVVIHSFFQYRTIVLLYWAVGSYLCLILEKGKKCSIPEKNQPENEK